MSNTEEKQDVYTRITNKIIAALEQGVRPWTKPWNAEHAAGKITRPLRHNGQPYSGINILMLWVSAMEQGFTAPIWMTFRQAIELNAHVRKGEKGSLVVYANAIRRTERDEETGEDFEREIAYPQPFFTLLNFSVPPRRLPNRPDSLAGWFLLSRVKVWKTANVGEN